MRQLTWTKTTAAALAAAVVVCAVAACGSGEAAPAVTERDSAGIRIVEVAVTPSAPLSWTIAPEPRVLIGGASPDPRAQLVRVTGAAVRSDGRIVVADGGASEVRLFEPDGTPMAAFGREGGGPGEFAGMSFFHLLPRDSAVVYDRRNRRLTVVTPAMELGRTVQPGDDGSAGISSVVAMLPSGRAVALGAAGFGGTPTTGVYDGAGPVVLLGPAGEVGDTLGVFPNRSSYIRFGEGSINILRVPFGAETSFAAGDDRVHIGTAKMFEILSFSADAELVRILRVEAPPRPVTDEDLRRFIEDAAAAAPEQARAGLRTMYGEVPLPERMPAYGDLIEDAAGNLWVERYRTPSEGPTTWMVFAPDGRPLGTVETPAGVRLLEIGEDYILGSGADALDRPYVAVWDREPGAS